MKNKSWQKMLAVPAALSIGLGGALLTIAPAHAVDAPEPVSSTSPTATPEESTAPTDAATTTPAPAPQESAAPTPSNSAAPAPVETDKPAPGPGPVRLPTPVVSTPTEGAQLQGSKITLTGKGNPGDYIFAVALTPEDYAAALETFEPPTASARAAAPAPEDPELALREFQVDSNGDWTATATVPSSGEYTVGAIMYTVGDDDVLTGASNLTAGVNVTVTVAALEAAAPVITAPAAGDVIRAKNITFTGTGEPGANIALFVATPSYFDEYVSEQLELLNPVTDEPAPGARVQALAAEPEPTDPNAEIIVDANGNWSAVLPLEIGAYRAGAVQLVTDETDFALSGLSATVDFSVAAVLPAPVALPGSDNTLANGSLPETGSDAGLFAGIGAALVLGGGALLFARRRMAASN